MPRLSAKELRAMRDAAKANGNVLTVTLDGRTDRVTSIRYNSRYGTTEFRVASGGGWYQPEAAPWVFREASRGSRANPRRRRNPSYTEGLDEAETELERSRLRAAYAARRRNPSTEVTELVLFITNDGTLYRQQTQPIIANLGRKIAKGTYDPTKALKLWGYLADAGAQKYTREFDSSPRTSFGAFSKADRVAAAKELADHYADELGTRSNPRHRRFKMARRKKSRTRRVRGYKGGIRVVRFRSRGGRVKIVRFHKPGTKGFRSGAAKKRAAGKRLARKWGFFRKGSAIYQKRPGRKSKLIRRL